MSISGSDKPTWRETLRSPYFWEGFLDGMSLGTRLAMDRKKVSS